MDGILVAWLPHLKSSDSSKAYGNFLRPDRLMLGALLTRLGPGRRDSNPCLSPVMFSLDLTRIYGLFSSEKIDATKTCS